jgi:CRP/FNR family transcriptional regulator
VRSEAHGTDIDCNLTVKHLEILSKFEFYQRAPLHFQEELARTAVHTNLQPGEYFFHEAGKSPHWALVGTGSIRVFKISESGRQITLYHVQDAQTCLVNMLCALLETGSPATAIVESPVEALLFPLLLSGNGCVILILSATMFQTMASD